MPQTRRIFEVRSVTAAAVTMGHALLGDDEAVRSGLRALLTGDRERLRHPDGYMPAAVMILPPELTASG